MVWLVKAKIMEDYKIFMEFNDGTNGIIDFKDKLANDHRQIIRDLLDFEKFKTVKVKMDTLCWDNGVDFAQDYLYEKIKKEESAA